MAISPLLNLPFGFFAFNLNRLQNRFFCLLFIPLLYKLLLDIKIYNHQILSISLTTIGYIIFLILYYLDDHQHSSWWDKIRFLISCLSFSLHFVLVKYLTIKYYFFSPGKIYISIGIIMLFLIIFGSIIYSLISYKDLSFFKISFDFSETIMGVELYIYSMLSFIFHVIYNILSFSVILHFDPNLYIINDIYRTLFFWIYQIIDDSSIEDTYSYIFKSIAYLIVFISTLIYNEIIIFNFCGLNIHTIKNLRKRLKSDVDLMSSDGIGENRDSEVEMQGGYGLKLEKTKTENSIELLVTYTTNSI